MFTRGMFGIINTLSTIFKLQHCLWKQVLSFCFGGRRCALPPSPHPVFLFKSNFAHLQYTSLHVVCVFPVFRYFFYMRVYLSFSLPFYIHKQLYIIYTYIEIIYIYTTWYIVILFTYNIIYTSFFLIAWGHFWSQNIFWSLALCIWSYTSSIKYQ